MSATETQPLTIDRLREDVAIGCQILELEDQGDIVWGHVSARDPGGRGVWMKASTFGFDEITPDHVILVSWDGEVLEGAHRRHIEYPIHTRLMKQREDVNSVVHTHAPWAVAFGATEEPLRPCSHEPTLFVPPDIARFTETGDLIVDDELGDALAASVAGRNAALMINHGIVAVGGTVQEAVITAVLLERACRTNLRALSAGGVRAYSSDEEALAKREHAYPPALVTQAWNYFARKVEGRA